MKMADRTLDLGYVCCRRYEYAFIDETEDPQVYAQYKSTAARAAS